MRLVGIGLGAYMGGVLFNLTQNYVTPFGGSSISGTVNLTILLLLAVRLRRVRPVRPMPAVTLVQA